jgi:bifunctional non-homologous end joining protein LigD
MRQADTMRAEDLRERVWPVQLATLVKEVPPRAADYLYELKFDGYRILAVKAGADLRLFSRRAQDWTNEFEVVGEAARKLRAKAFVVDGEVCALDPRGVPSFQLLQNRRGHDTRLAYFVFDLLWVDGKDLRTLPLEDRRDRLARLLGKLPKDSRIVLSSAVPGDPKEILRTACASGLEGIVAKEKGSPYVGGRQASWLKIKCTLRQEFALAGYIPYLGTHVGEVGGLMLALKGKDGAFHYAGKVGTGFTSAMRRTLGKLLEADHTDTSQVADPPRLGGIARWSRLKLVGEVAFTEWTGDGHVRHPSFQGLRKDKTPDECVREDTTGSEDNRDMRG